MANKSKHLKENVKQKNSKKRAEKKAALQNQKFNFDNEIVIGVNVIPKNQKDKPSASKRNNAVKKVSNKKASSDYQKAKNNKNIESKGMKDKKRKKVNFKRIIKIILLMAFIIGATIFVMTTPIFNVTEINVEGNSRISNERIESLSKISLNVNTYQYSKKNIIENIKEEPYIESVQVKRKLPSTIIINVEERNRDFFILNYGSYIYIDKQGYILEISNEVEKLPEIKGFSTSTENLVPGNRISDDDLEKINTAQKIIENIKNNEIESEITSIDVSNTNDFCVIMQGEGKKIHLGNASNINDKILMLKEILTKEKGKTGEIFIENLEKVYFREASWIE